MDEGFETTCAGSRASIEGSTRHSSDAVTLDGTSGLQRQQRPLCRGDVVSRYVVLECIGAGGMGVVYAAYDPELDRRVALKIIDGRRDTSQGRRARSRLLREARAMARLAHPNVITVHDVGTDGDRVFVAMEHVDGMTLTEWLAARPRRWSEVLVAFEHAGRGLQAAHAAGLVHRDFKPDNVMIDARGHVRVMDFGIARALSTGQDTDETSADGSQTSAATDAVPQLPKALASIAVGHADGDDRLTRPGALAGTPAYMAPETIHGAPTDPRADQFSFCVALHEALYGVRPFRGETLGVLAFQIVHGEVQSPASDCSVPAWLRRVVLRGLSARPEERYATMADLLQALADGRRRRRRWRWVTAIGLSLMAAGLGGGTLVSTRAARTCQGNPEPLAPAWSEDRARAVLEAFAATEAPDAVAIAERVRDGLDDYAADWDQGRRDACEATRVRGEQSEEMLDRRMLCLAERRQQVAALVDVFAAADADVVAQSIDAVMALEPSDDCSDSSVLLEKYMAQPAAKAGHPDSSTSVARVGTGRAKLSEAQALLMAGKVEQAPTVAADAVVLARESGDARLLVDALLVLAQSQSRAGQAERAIMTLQETVEVAGTHGLDESEALGWIRMVEALGADLERFDEALGVSRAAHAAVFEAGRPDALVAAHHNALGNVHLRAGNHDEAAAAFEQALALRQKLLPAGHPERTRVENNLGLAAMRQGRYEDAERLLRGVIADREAALGPEHAELATPINNLGSVVLRQGRDEEALALYRRALSIRERTLPSIHPDLAASIANVGLVAAKLGRHDEALEQLERARTMQVRSLGPEHPTVGRTLINVSAVLVDADRPQRAEDAARRAIEILEAAGVGAAELTTARTALAMAMHRRGRVEQARTLLDDVIRDAEAALGDAHPSVASARALRRALDAEP